MNKYLVIKIIIIGIIIVIVSIGGAFYIFNSQKIVAPTSSKPLENRAIEVLEKQPSKTLKNYIDDVGFSFNYPDDIRIGKKEISDNITYANLELTSSEVKGSITIKIADTKLQSIDDWFIENKLATSSAIKAAVRNIKIGDLSGQEIKDVNRLVGGALDKSILFLIEVRSYDKYWLDVYNTILSSFNFVPQQSQIETETLPLDDSSGSDVILEEETVE